MTTNSIVEKILANAGQTFQNLTPAQLVQHAIKNGEGVLTDTGALMADTGEFTGRSPKDKFCVADAKTENTVWWGDVNQKFEPAKFDALLNIDDMLVTLLVFQVFILAGLFKLLHPLNIDDMLVTKLILGTSVADILRELQSSKAFPMLDQETPPHCSISIKRPASANQLFQLMLILLK